MTAFGSNLKKIREARNLTQAELADMLGTTKQVISRYENGTRSPKISVVAEYAEKLGMSISSLSNEDMRPDPQPFSPVTEVAQIPIVGSLRCGRGGIAMQVLEGTRMAANVKHPDEYVYFHATGDSMEPLISEGDYALIHKQDTIESGEIAAVCVGATDDFFIEGMIKKVKLELTRLTLISLNSKYDPMIFDREEMNNVKIVGKVIRIEKDL